MRMSESDRQFVLGQLIDEYGGDEAAWLNKSAFDNVIAAVEAVVVRHVREATRDDMRGIVDRRLRLVADRAVSIYDHPAVADR